MSSLLERAKAAGDNAVMVALESREQCELALAYINHEVTVAQVDSVIGPCTLDGPSMETRLAGFIFCGILRGIVRAELVPPK